MVQIFKIFLASSKELVDDRRALEIHVGRLNKELVPQGVHLVLEQWEDFLDVMAQGSLQHEYERAARECDLFLMLFCTKVGKYTLREFEAAFQQFKTDGRPLILTYFKDAPITTGSINRQDLLSLLEFQEKLQQLGNFQTVYKNTEHLLLQVRSQLDKIAPSPRAETRQHRPGARYDLTSHHPYR